MSYVWAQNISHKPARLQIWMKNYLLQVGLNTETATSQTFNQIATFIT